MLYRWTLNNQILNQDPLNWNEAKSTTKRDDLLKGLLFSFTNEFVFVLDGYDVLNNARLVSDCSTVTAKVEYRCNDLVDFETVFEGIIIIKDVKFNLSKKQAKATIEDNTFVGKILSSRNQKAVVNVGISKNQVAITPSPSTTGDFFKPSDGLYSYPSRTIYKVFDVFTFLISYMTDGAVTFTSDFFSTGLGKDWVILTGKELRLADNTTTPDVSFFQMFDELNKKVNLSFAIEGTAIRIEPESYFFASGNITFMRNIQDLELSYNDLARYSRIDVGSEKSLNTGTYPDIRLQAFKEEDYSIGGDCNDDNTLDLVSDFIIDSNVIEDVLVNGTTSYDTDIFLVETTAGLNHAKQFDSISAGSPPYNYNDSFLNINVITNWFNGLPEGVFKFLTDGNDEFLADTTNATTQTITASTIIEPIDFDNEIADVNANYDNALYHYNVPASGVYSFESGVRLNNIVWNVEVQGNLTIYVTVKRYNSALTLLLDSRQIIRNINDSDTGNQLFILFPDPMYCAIGDKVRVEFRFDFVEVLPSGGDVKFDYNDSYFEAVATPEGGGEVQQAPLSFKDKIYTFTYPMNKSDHDSIISDPKKKVVINYGDDPANDVKGWIKEIAYDFQSGNSQIKVVSDE